MEREPADRYGMCSSTHTAVVVRTRSPTTHTHHPHRQTPRQVCTQQNSAQRDQSNADPTQDVTGSCWRRVLELVPSGPPARRQGVDSAPWGSRGWADVVVLWAETKILIRCTRIIHHSAVVAAFHAAPHGVDARGDSADLGLAAPCGCVAQCRAQARAHVHAYMGHADCGAASVGPPAPRGGGDAGEAQQAWKGLRCVRGCGDERRRGGPPDEALPPPACAPQGRPVSLGRQCAARAA